MNMMQKSLLALAVIATTAVNVQAASNVDVKVIGRIDPGTCTPTLAGGGTVDYGTMSPSSLAATGMTVLPLKTVDFSIACTAPSKVAVTVVNGRPNTMAGNTEGVTGFGFIRANVAALFGATGTTAVSVAGLGESNGAKVGGYGLRMLQGSAIADSVAVAGVTAVNMAVPVWVNGGGNMLDYASVRGISWAATGTTTPIAFTNLSAKMEVQAYLNEKSAFDLTNTVELDGLSTLELVYLP